MHHILNILAVATSQTVIQPGDLPTPHTGPKELKAILQIVFAVIGALALLVITLSGLRYIVANGDPQKISKAKNGIVYSLVGLIIAISAESIVSYVVFHI